MKTLITFLVLGSLNVFAQERVPNLYMCQTDDGTVTASYSTSGKTGKPGMTLHDHSPDALVQKFSGMGSDLKVEAVSVGTLVSLQDNSLVVKDGPAITASLLIPNATLNEKNLVNFRSVVVFTATVLRGPAPGYSKQEYKSVNVSCTARKVMF